MRRLFFKIFVIFWIAQSLIIAISTVLIVRHRFPHPASLYDSLVASLQLQGQQRIAAFESGGCSAFSSGTDSATLALSGGHGEPLCGRPVQPLAGGENPLDAVPGRQLGNRFFWFVPVLSPTGRHYTFQFSSPHKPDTFSLSHELLHFSFPQLPVAIAVSGLTTFLLTFLFTQPVAKLRRAARELAHGNLSTRVPVASPLPRGGQDELQALILDFNHMAERLESLVQAHKLLLRDVSHELRSPLARLSVALELAHEDAATGKVEHLERIEREAGRLNQLINQLLTLSAMEFLEDPHRTDMVSLTEVVEDVCADAQFEAQQQGCSVISDLQPGCTVRGDRELLHRAIENVVRNAIRYTDAGTEVQIGLHTSTNTTPMAILQVRDHGPGIPESEVDNVLKPFYRLDPARSRFTGGFGVGLAITERVVKLHGGVLSITNHSGSGATLRLVLPVVDSATELASQHT